MTGDSERTARAVAAKVGVDEYYSEVLPEDKASFVEKRKQKDARLSCWVMELTIPGTFCS